MKRKTTPPKKKLSIALSGASGRMGQAVRDLIAKKNSGFCLIGKTPPLININKWDKKQIEVVIDFSSPELFENTLAWSVKNKVPLVSGTTALSPLQKRKIKRATQKIPVFYEENMSWGIWQIKQWIKNTSNEDYKILMEDIHHKNKKDKPSGTALKLEKNFPHFLRKKLKIKSIRKGDVFGTHKIFFKSAHEVVSLEHKALSRHLFASGALKAASWVRKKPPGLYSFEDIFT